MKQCFPEVSGLNNAKGQDQTSDRLLTGRCSAVSELKVWWHNSADIKQKTFWYGWAAWLLVLRAVLMCTETSYIYGKSDRAVQITSSNEVVLSADGQLATPFKVVACLASDTVSAPQRPACVSFMDATRPDWYVRHWYMFLHVHPINTTDDLQIFKLDSSFIAHQITSNLSIYSFESVNFGQHYISSQADGRLMITPIADITDLQHANFRLSDSPST